MSRLTDEQIQQLIETGKSLPDAGSARQTAEGRLYQHLFGELKKELPIQPDASFSDRVISRIEGLKPAPSMSVSKSRPSVWLWIVLAICLMGILFIVLPTDGMMADLMSMLAVLKPIKWGLLFGLLSLLLIQVLDFKLIREPSLPKLI